MAGPIPHPGIDELLLEGGDQMQLARRVERGDGAAQKLPPAALPGAPVVADVAEDEMFWRRAISEIDAGLGRSYPERP